MGDHLLHCTPPLPDVDYLSDLPDALLYHILSFLSSRDSVRTSVLARRWRSVWASVPSIHFHTIEYPNALELTSDIVHRFVASRSNSSPVSSLRLAFVGRFTPLEAHLRQWIDYAKSHGVREVVIRLRCFRFLDPSFCNLFDWPSLVSLDLRDKQCAFGGGWPRVDIPPECISLRNLKRLSLAVYAFSEQSITRLLACCSALEELFLNVLLWSDDDIEIAITVPNLRKLTLIEAIGKTRIICPKLERLSIQNRCRLEQFHAYMPSLVSVHLYEYRWCCALASSLCTVTELSTSLRSIPSDQKELRCMIDSFKMFHNLKKLKVHLEVTSMLAMHLLFLFLQHTPNICSLNLIVDGKCQGPSFIKFDDWRECRHFKSYKSFNNLKLVSLNIKSEWIRSTILKMLSERVQDWDQVVVMYN